MKKYVFLALALALSLSVTVFANHRFGNLAQAQAATPSDEERTLYEQIYKETNLEKRAPLCKEFVGKFPQSQYAAFCQKVVDRWELTKLYGKYQEAEKAFVAPGGATEANLKNLVTAGDVWLGKTPTDIGVIVRLATANGFGLMTGLHKDTARAYADAEKALKVLEPTAPPAKEWKPDVWAKFRTENTSLLLQYQGLSKLRQTPADVDGALALLNKSAEMKDGLTVKDPNTYLWRAEANGAVYAKMNDSYKALTDDEKRGEKGKEMLSKIYPVGEKIVHDNARVVALTSKPELKSVSDGAKEDAETYYKILMDGKTAGLDDLYKRYQADVTAPNTPIRTEAATTAATSDTTKSGKATPPVKATATRKK